MTRREKIAYLSGWGLALATITHGGDHNRLGHLLAKGFDIPFIPNLSLDDQKVFDEFNDEIHNIIKD